jgi:iron complex transport system substrate-binding protein
LFVAVAHGFFMKKALLFLFFTFGRKVQIAEPLTRVVSLIPSLTETSYEVGGGDRLVGATRFATFPAAAAKLPRVGSYIALDIERIVKLKPQLCLATKDGNPKASVERLESLGIPVFVFDPKSLEDVIDTVVRLGEIYGMEEQAAVLVSGYQRRLDKVALQLEGVKDRPRVFFQIDAQPIFSAGSDTFLHQLLVRSGAVNLAVMWCFLLQWEAATLNRNCVRVGRPGHRSRRLNKTACISSMRTCLIALHQG